MRILVLVHEYPPIGGGGGRVAQDVARRLAQRGHDVHVLAPHMIGLKEHSLDEGVHLVRIPSFRRKAFVGDLLAMSGYLIIGFFAGLRLIFRIKPDVIHVHFAVPAGALAWALSKLTGVPFVLTSHLGDVPGGVPEKTDRWFKWIYPFTPRIWRDAAAVTAVSGFTRRLALSHYPVEVNVIPNGIAIHSKPVEIRLNPSPKIIFAGRFVPQKNPLLIPEILNGLKELSWQCIMIGDGLLRNSLIEKIESLGLKDRFILPGWESTDEVSRFLHESDILLMPSSSEGTPMVGLQALSAGLAIVASNVGGVSELVEHGINGFLHKPDDVRSFTASISRLLSDPGLLGVARGASLEISRKFDLSHVVNQYEEVLSNASRKG